MEIFLELFNNRKKLHDNFEVNDLSENENMTQIQTIMTASVDLIKSKGFHTTINITEKQTR